MPGVSGSMEHLDLQFADPERFTVGEQIIEFGPGAGHVGRIEHAREDLLHFTDMGTDTDPSPGPGLDQRRRGQVIGMGVGFKHACDSPVAILRGSEDGFRRPGRNLARSRIEIEHRVNDRRFAGGGIANQIGHGEGRFVKKAWICAGLVIERLLDA